MNTFEQVLKTLTNLNKHECLMSLTNLDKHESEQTLSNLNKQVLKCLNVWCLMNVWWMSECMNIWISECMNVWMYECLNVCMSEQTNLNKRMWTTVITWTSESEQTTLSNSYTANESEQTNRSNNFVQPNLCKQMSNTSQIVARIICTQIWTNESEQRVKRIWRSKYEQTNLIWERIMRKRIWASKSQQTNTMNPRMFSIWPQARHNAYIFTHLVETNLNKRIWANQSEQL